ncbi:OmpA family protein [Micromonospora sp. A3M-1-15]|uniref:OmpA family protein n=1 Tax=Micromonospora sp. A3M-1-15 TaxID=2962035 RepID=UPI0020B80E9A|nr:OmpA family protein [Micromonospora sp. A3M-1-15]MCP3785304.1 OmpA family protein [Micromonospora sp. A3M-1-15]
MTARLMSAARRLARLGAVATLVGASLVTVSSCRMLPREPGACGWMKEPSDVNGRTVLLVDGSNSVRTAGSPSRRPDYRTATERPVRDAVQRRDSVSVAAFSGTTGDLTWTVRNLSTDWRKDDDNPDNQHDRRRDAEGCLAEQVRKAQVEAPQAPGTDILRAIDHAAQWLKESGGPKHLVIATDGLITIGCASLVQSSFGSQREIDAIAGECGKGELRADELRDIDVHLVGVGHPAAEQPVPTTAGVQWLADLWRKLCQTAGGSCTVSTSSAIGAKSDGDAAARPDASVTDPPVRFGVKETVFSLSAAALFDTGRAELRAEGERLLLGIAVSIRTGTYHRVDVRGYADPRGNADENKALSGQRADAVAEFLSRNGVTRVTPHGLGETTTCPYQSPASANATEEERLQCFRRVDIVAS